MGGIKGSKQRRRLERRRNDYDEIKENTSTVRKGITFHRPGSNKK